MCEVTYLQKNSTQISMEQSQKNFDFAVAI